MKYIFFVTTKYFFYLPAPVPCEQILDICILIDSSGSCRDRNPPDGSYDNWDLLRRFASDLIDRFSVGWDATRFGIVVFSDRVRLEIELDDYMDAESLKDHLMRISYMGRETNTPEAFRMTRQECFSEQRGDRPNVDNLAVIITDGLPYPDYRKDPAVREAQLLRATGTRMVAVGVTDVIDRQMLSQFSSAPQQEGVNYFTAPTFAALNEIGSIVAEGSCVTGKISYIFLRIYKCIIMYREIAKMSPFLLKYFAVDPCEEQIDMCLIIDSSGSIRDNNPSDGSFDNWSIMRQFAVDIIDYFTIGPDATRVGAIIFSDNVQMVFNMLQYRDAASVKNALRNLQFLGQETNTPDALLMARQQCFQESNGDRPNVQNLAIVISDGVPYPPRRRQPAIAQAEVLRSTGTKIVSVGITNRIDEMFLKDISSTPHVKDQDYFTSPSFIALNEISRSVAQGSCVPPTPRKNSLNILFMHRCNHCHYNYLVIT